MDRQRNVEHFPHGVGGCTRLIEHERLTLSAYAFGIRDGIRLILLRFVQRIGSRHRAGESSPQSLLRLLPRELGGMCESYGRDSLFPLHIAGK